MHLMQGDVPIGRHRLHEVRHLMGHALERRAGHLGRCRRGRHTAQDRRGRAIPMRSAQAGKGGHEGDPTGVLCAMRKFAEDFTSGAAILGSQQARGPVQRLARRQNVALPRVGRSGSPPGDRRIDPLRRGRQGRERNHHRGTGPVGRLTHTRRIRTLGVQRSMGIGEHRQDWHAIGDGTSAARDTEVGI